ncbi:hypothetical protein RDABS01_006399 [Bienertia sinuspersici]
MNTNGVVFDPVTYTTALSFLMGLSMHCMPCHLRTGFLSELNVSNSHIIMYAKFESMMDSNKVFEELHYRDIVSWNILISGYDQNKLYKEVLEAFFSAISEALPNEYTFGSVLSAVGSAEAISLRLGQRCHSHLLKLGLNYNPIVSAALLNMYAKRGSLYESNMIFEESVQRTQFAWTAIISAHVRHGYYDSVMKIFDEMANQGVKPDCITFLSMLTACGRKGMQIPGGPSFSALQSLLGSCRTYRDMEMGRRVSNKLIEMEPEESGSYVLMSNLYGESGDWEKVAMMRRKMRDSRVRKEVEFSWVDVGNTDGSLIMHGFSSDDVSHPRCEEIYHVVECLGLEMKFLKEEKAKKGLFVLN